MKKLVLATACVAAIGWVGSAMAQEKCWTDYAGAAVCRDARGNQYYPPAGATNQGARDAQETTTYYRNSRGDTVVKHTDGEGDSVWRDDEGRTAVGHTETTGGDGLKDSTGRTIRCRSYGYGRKICR